MANSIASQPPHSPVQSTSTRSWTFTLTADSITDEEQALFADDLNALGLEPGIWTVLNAVLSTGTRYSRPLVVRAHDGETMVGLAVIYECRRYGACFFDPPMSTLMDTPGIPMFLWLRYGATVDHCANPGFVRKGIDRGEFVQRVTSQLLQEYMLGTVVEYDSEQAGVGAVTTPFVDSGLIDVGELSGIEGYLGRSKSLSRKRKKFANKGGEIKIVQGSLPENLRTAALDGFQSLEIMIRTPYQDNYLSMADAVMMLDSPEMVHIVALLDGEYAGHQSFCRSGNALHCQAGAFDRRRTSTYHAYENIIVTSVEYALEHGLDCIDYGPALNETKKKMMTRFIRCENRIYGRYRFISAVMPHVLRRSKIGPDRMASWVGLGEQAAEQPLA